MVDDDDNDVYETIEFSDSSSHVYTEPIRDYGVLRKVTIKTSPKQHHGHRKPSMGLKKSVGSRNLQNFTAMENVAEAADDENENEPNVELRMKPHKHNSDKLTNSLISVGLHETSVHPCCVTTNSINLLLGRRSGIYSRKCGQFYPTQRCFGYFNQFRMFKFKAKK